MGRKRAIFGRLVRRGVSHGFLYLVDTFSNLAWRIPAFNVNRMCLDGNKSRFGSPRFNQVAVLKDQKAPAARKHAHSNLIHDL